MNREEVKEIVTEVLGNLAISRDGDTICIMLKDGDVKRVLHLDEVKEEKKECQTEQTLECPDSISGLEEKKEWPQETKSSFI